jgi:tRNA pseudouridine32 synthase/23S rRNA pseudouridine746 synthase
MLSIIHRLCEPWLPEILFEDEGLLIVYKPSGLLAVPGRGPEKQDCLASRLRVKHPEALIVHRLDMATSGLMVLARNKDMHRRLSILFGQRQVKKTYVAVVDGALARATGEIDLPLLADWPNRPLQKVDFDVGKPSLTRYRQLSYDPGSDSSRLELHPETGRTHQLRLHLQAIGHPILGDALYASATIQAKAERLLLHAEGLSFSHPEDGVAMSFSCPAPF